MVTVTFFETEEIGIDGFAVGFQVVADTEETGVVDGFSAFGIHLYG